MPWDRTDPHPLLADHVAGRDGTGLRAVVVGRRLRRGRRAPRLARATPTTAFDISPAAVAATRERYPGSDVDYRVADLLDLPDDLVGTFDLVVEIYTIQALHGSLRDGAVAGVRRLVAPGGTLFVVQIVRDDDEEVGRGAAVAAGPGRDGGARGRGAGRRVAGPAAQPRPRPRLRDRWRMVLTRR